MDLGVILAVVWPYLAALYALDCLLVVRSGHLLYSGTVSSGFRIRGPGVRLAGLLPWGWSVLSTRESPVLSEQGIYVRAVPFPNAHRPLGPDDFTLIPYDEIREVRRDGREVAVNGGAAHWASTGIEASLLSRRIRMFRDIPSIERREAVRRYLAEATDVEAIRGFLEDVKRSASPLITASALLFGGVLILIPLSLLIRLPLPGLWIEVAFILAAYLAVLVLWWRTHRTFFPEEAGDRLEELFILILFPVSALHAFSKLTRRFFAPFDSTALTAVLAPSSAPEVLKREYIRVRATATSDGGEDFTMVWKMKVKALEGLAEKTELDLISEEVLSAATGDAEGATCPLCGAGYREGVEECADCGIPLKGLRA